MRFILFICRYLNNINLGTYLWESTVPTGYMIVMIDYLYRIANAVAGKVLGPPSLKNYKSFVSHGGTRTAPNHVFKTE